MIRCIDEEWEFGDNPTILDVAEICGVTADFVTAIHAQYSRQGRLSADSVLDRGAAIRIAQLIDEVA